MPLLAFDGTSPVIDSTVFVAPDAWITGAVTIGANSSVFFHAVLRGDILPIRIGAGTNIQDHAMVHTSHGLSAAIIGSDVTVGHRAIVHGATVEDLCIIGMGATLLDGSVIGTGSIVGAHTLVPKGTIIPPRSLVIGTPGKVVRQLSDQEVNDIRQSAAGYRKTSAVYRVALP